MPLPSQPEPLARSPHAVEVCADPAEELLRLACLTYGADDAARRDAAEALLRSQPSLARANVHTMAAFGDHTALVGALDADPAAANRQGGPFQLEPLLYATYARVGPAYGGDAKRTVRVLLERGADPNAGYLWDGNAPPFTVLTGAFGGGEGGQSPHPQVNALAELLLAAGADANDGQTIYNRGLGGLANDDVEHLELLFAHGLGAGDGGPWARRLGAELDTPADLLAAVLHHGAEYGLLRRVRLALAHGGDPNRGGVHPAFAGRTPYQGALRNGNLTIAAMLEEAGADPAAADAVTRFAALCMSPDRHAVDLAVATDPTLHVRARARDPALLIRAAELGRVDAVRVLAERGWDVNLRRRTTALHEAALRGNTELCRALLALGADRMLADTEFNAPPSGWAFHAGHPELAAELTPEPVAPHAPGEPGGGW